MEHTQTTSLSTAHLVELLASPTKVFTNIIEDKRVRAPQLFAVGVLCFGFYGCATGMYSGWQGAAFGLCKGMLIPTLAQILCLPSLFIFACLSGLAIQPAQAFRISALLTAMVGLILLAFAPVAWLFSISTDSLGFIVSLNLLIAASAYLLARRIFQTEAGQPKRNRGLQIWLVLQLFVTFQMTTVLRPIIAPEPQLVWAAEKKIFVQHFFESFSTEKR